MLFLHFMLPLENNEQNVLKIEIIYITFEFTELKFLIIQFGNLKKEN